MSSSSLWSKSSSQVPTRKATDWKDVVPKSSTLQDIMTKVYDGAYANGELVVHVVGAELQPANMKAGNPFCVLQLKNTEDKAEGKQYKTAIIHKDINPCWNEAFIMELRSKTDVALNIDVRSYTLIGKDKQLGKCIEEISNEKQFKLISSDKEEIGTITLNFNYTSAIRRNLDYVIATENYDLISKLLFDKDGTLVVALSTVCNDDELSMVLIRLFNSHSLSCSLLSLLISSEIHNRGDPTTLFRTDSMATKTMRNYFHLISRKSYLNQQILPLVNEITAIVQKGGSLEVFPHMLRQREILEDNIHNLWNVTGNLIKRVLTSFDAIPGNIKKFFGVLAGILEAKYGTIMWQPVASLFFLRFFCPGVVFPIECGIVHAAFRGLLLVGKVLQGVAGRAEFREEPLKPFNDLASHYSLQMDQFIKQLCAQSNASKAANQLGPVDDPRQPYSKDELAKLLAIILRKIKMCIDFTDMNFDKITKVKIEENNKSVKMKEITNLLATIFEDIK